MPDDTHVVALLGKSHANQSSEISREFARRLDTYVNVISHTSPAGLHVAVCGRREAGPAMRWLQREHGHLLPPPDRRFEDGSSRNSIQNFEQLGRYLTALLSPQFRRVHLTVVSADYHVARLRFVDEHLPQQSLVNSVAAAVEPEMLRWECVEFSPPPDAADAIRWCSTLYTVSEQLMPLQINIEGMLQLRLNRIVETVYSRFCSSLSALEKLVDSPPAQIRTEFRPTLDAAGRHVRSIAKLSDRLAAHVEVIGGPVPELEDLCQVMRDALRSLRTATDLDGPEFDGLYEAE